MKIKYSCNGVIVLPPSLSIVNAFSMAADGANKRQYIALAVHNAISRKATAEISLAEALSYLFCSTMVS